MIDQETLRALFTEGEEFQVFSEAGEPEKILGNDGREYYKVVTVTQPTEDGCCIDGEWQDWETIGEAFMAEKYVLHEGPWGEEE